MKNDFEVEGASQKEIFSRNRRIAQKAIFQTESSLLAALGLDGLQLAQIATNLVFYTAEDRVLAKNIEALEAGYAVADENSDPQTLMLDRMVDNAEIGLFEPVKGFIMNLAAQKQDPALAEDLRRIVVLIPEKGSGVKLPKPSYLDPRFNGAEPSDK